MYESPDIHLSIPVLHGGEIGVSGDVSGDSLLELVKNSPPGVVMSTKIFIDGMLLREYSDDVIGGIVDEVVDIVYSTDDSDMLGFYMSFDEDSDTIDFEKTIRGWKIKSGINSSNLSFISVEKIHSLL